MLLLMAATAFFSACNKLELEPTPAEQPTQETSPTLTSLLDNPDFSILKAAMEKAGTFSSSPSLLTLLSSPTERYTFFAPDDAAFARSGIPSAAALAFFSAGALDTALRCHVIPQSIPAASISTGFPNFQYPTLFNPAPSINALLRLTIFPSARPGTGAWVNNIPITQTDIQAVNGVLHKVYAVVMPPSADLFTSISNDAELNYLEAAIQRADSGVAAGGRLRDAIDLSVNPLAIASNLTVFAPTDAAMKTFLTGAITQALIAKGFPAATAQAGATAIVANTGTLLLSNPALIPDIPGIPVAGLGPQLAAVITPDLAKAIVAYHIISSQSGTYAPPGLRIFSVNAPTTATQLKTLLMPAAPLLVTDPLVTVQATFVPGQPFVGALTVKGIGNTTASNVLISLTPPFKSDLNTINGVIHKIDQVLLPPPRR